MNQFTPLQQEVRQKYAEGEMTYIDTPDELPDCGDTLFAFAMYEAKDAGEDREELRRMLDTAIDQLKDLRDAL